MIFPFIFETLFSQPAQLDQHHLLREKCTKDNPQRSFAAAVASCNTDLQTSLSNLKQVIMEQSRGYRIGSLMSLTHCIWDYKQSNGLNLS